jgi:hypothetical protein
LPGRFLSRAAEPPFAARRVLQIIYVRQRYFFDPLDHKLGDAVATFDVKGFALIGVDHYDRHLSAITGINKPRRVHKRNSMARRESASWQNESSVSPWDGDGYSSGDQSSLAGLEHIVNAAGQVQTCITLVLVSRHR